MAPVRALLVDVGGVLLDWHPRHLYRRLIADEAELERFLAQVCTLDWNLTLDAGRPFDEACAELAARHPDHADLVHAWVRQAEMIRGEVPGMAALVDRLARRGVPRYLLTNMPRWVFDERQAAYPVLRRFDGAVVSGDEGIVKPDPAIFRLALTRFGLDPATTLFVDDSAVNVEAAADLGFRVHHFVDAPGLEQELVALGVLSPA